LLPGKRALWKRLGPPAPPPVPTPLKAKVIIIIIIKNFVCSPKGFSAYNYNMQFKIKLYYTIQNLSYDCLLKPSYI
jgi:hypothetical protein